MDKGRYSKSPVRVRKSLELTTLDRYKLSDNARRAVTPIFQYFMLFLSFVLPSHAPRRFEPPCFFQHFSSAGFFLCRSLIDSRFYSLSRRFTPPLFQRPPKFFSVRRFSLFSSEIRSRIASCGFGLAFSALITKKTCLNGRPPTTPTV